MVIVKSENNKILSIVDELLANSLEADSTEISINIIREEEEDIIKITDNGKGMDEETFKKVKRILNQPYRKDMEEYYGSLAGSGHSVNGNFGGLNLVGFQIDSADIISSEEGTTFLVKRKRNHESKKR